ncbi:MAG: sigma-70 family RNA polymerase sigma factor [Demequinaceae bacterium]|nr:sigma-70 family RNA polymerase sigma factor [Demequinaceae bacterium]
MGAWRGLLAEVVETRHASLVAYGYLLTSSRPDAEDLVQDALVKVFSRVRTLPNAAAADQYVRKAMLTLYLDRRRRDQAWGLLRRSIATADGVVGPEDTVAASTDVRASLAALSPRERACVVLRHFDDLSVAEIAARLGLAEGSVKRYLSDGLRRLGSELIDDGATVSVVAHGREGRN